MDSSDHEVFSFRCAVESVGSAAHHQTPACESELSQLMCPQASVSRLTYVSEQESTCPTMTSDHGLEDHKVGSSFFISLVRLLAPKCY